MSNKLKKLRKKYPKFVYENYSYKLTRGSLVISFKFLIEPDIKFNPKVKIKKVDKKKMNAVDEKELDNLIL
jgi:hypothetical protein